MSNDYAAGLLIEQHHHDLLQEAQNERLARLARRSHTPRRRWWERLMLFRTRSARGAGPAATTASRSTAGSRATATVAAGESPC